MDFFLSVLFVVKSIETGRIFYLDPFEINRAKTPGLLIYSKGYGTIPAIRKERENAFAHFIRRDCQWRAGCKTCDKAIQALHRRPLEFAGRNFSIR